MKNKPLVRRYLLWLFKITKESFERIERKTTQLLVDEYMMDRVKTTKGVPVSVRKEYDGLVKEFDSYIKSKRMDELKLKFLNDKDKTLHPQYIYLRNKLQAVEEAIKHFLGEKELRKMRALYEKEFTNRILQARDH